MNLLAVVATIGIICSELLTSCIGHSSAKEDPKPTKQLSIAKVNLTLEDDQMQSKNLNILNSNTTLTFRTVKDIEGAPGLDTTSQEIKSQYLFYESVSILNTNVSLSARCFAFNLISDCVSVPRKN